MSLEPVFKLLEDISKISSRNAKKNHIKNNMDVPFFKEVVLYAYDSRKVFNINQFPQKASKIIRKCNTEEIFKTLDKYADKKGVSKSEIEYLHNACIDDSTCKVVGRIVNGDLRCGVNLKTWKEFFPSLFEHSPMLCGYAVRFLHRYDTFSQELDTFISSCGGWDNVIGSIKANGVRVWIDHTGKKPLYISRSGKVYENFYILNNDSLKVAKALQQKYGLENLPILDGEVTFEGEDFQDQMRQVRRIKDMDPSKFRLVLFDSPSLDGIKQDERSETLRTIVENFHEEGYLNKTSFTEEVMFEGFQDFKDYFLEVVKVRKLEGLVLKNAREPYDTKKSPFWCKVKDWFSADCKVIGVEEGTGKYKGLLGALLVDFNGVTVKVGSGYNDNQREWFFKTPPKVIEVEYKTITKDGSMQHPSFVKEREDLEGII